MKLKLFIILLISVLLLFNCQYFSLMTLKDWQNKNNFNPHNSIKFVSQFGSTGTGNGQFNGIGQIAIDSLGNIYVIDTGNYRVEKFDPTGNFLLQFGSYGTGNGQFYGMSGIAVDGNDNIYVGDNNGPSYDRVQKFNVNGKYISQFGGYSGTAGNGLFWDITWIFTDKNNNTWVGDWGAGIFQEFDKNGVYMRQIGDGSIVGAHADGFAIDSKGNYYISDEDSSTPWDRVVKFDPNGNYMTMIFGCGKGNGQFGIAGTSPGPYGIAIDENDYLYVTDNGNQRVEIFDSNLNYVTQIGMTDVSGSAEGLFNGLIDVKLDSHGNIYVVDSGNNRVQVFRWSSQ